MAKGVRQDIMKKVPLSKVKDHLSEYLHAAEKEDVVILRHGKPAGGLIGFENEDDWFDYRVENDSMFLHRIASARRNIQESRGTRLEDLSEGSPGKD